MCKRPVVFSSPPPLSLRESHGCVLISDFKKWFRKKPLTGVKGHEKEQKVRGVAAAVATPPIHRPRPHPAHFFPPTISSILSEGLKKKHVLRGYGLGSLDSQCEVGMVKCRGDYLEL